MLALIIIIAIGVFVGVLMAKNPANAFMVVFGSAFVPYQREGFAMISILIVLAILFVVFRLFGMASDLRDNSKHYRGIPDSVISERETAKDRIKHKVNTFVLIVVGFIAALAYTNHLLFGT